MVKVSDLKDQLGEREPRAFLYCSKCGAEYSAHAGDYWDAPADHVFKCCRHNMILVTARRVLEEVR